MKKQLKHSILIFLFVISIIVQAPFASAVSLTSETQIDGISLTTTGTGITFGDFSTSVSGTIYSGGVAVPGYSRTDTGAGSFITGADGSVVSSIPPYTNATGTRYAQINSSVAAAPAAANPDPLANPLDSDFVVLGSTTANSLSGMVRATDSAVYSQAFTVNGTGDLTFMANYLYYFALEVSPGENPFTTAAISKVHFEIGLGTDPIYTFDLTPFAISLLDPDDPLNRLDISNLFTKTFTGIADGTSGYFLAQVFTDTQVNSVPEPNIVFLLSLGIPWLAILRKKMGLFGSKT